MIFSKKIQMFSLRKKLQRRNALQSYPGTINVVEQPMPQTITTGNSTDQPSANIDTVGTLMVPTEDLTTYTSDLENGGISVLSTHNFNDIRGGDPQTLVTWGTASGTNSLDHFFFLC